MDFTGLIFIFGFKRGTKRLIKENPRSTSLKRQFKIQIPPFLGILFAKSMFPFIICKKMKFFWSSIYDYEPV